MREIGKNAAPQNLGLSICTWTCHKKNCMPEFTENAAPQERDHRFAQACTIEMHMDMDISKGHNFVQEFRGKCRAPELSRALCAGLHSRNAHGHLTGANTRKMPRPRT
jgi:hypothetical protein